MSYRRNLGIAIATALSIPAAWGCTSSDPMSADTDDEGDDVMVQGDSCPGAGGELAEGAPCATNGDCASGVCSIYRDAPINMDAVCAAAPDDCASRFTGTVLDYASGAPVAGVRVSLTTAGAAIEDANNAPVILQMFSDEAGRYDDSSPNAITDAPLAVIALAWDDAHGLTASGLAQPPPGEDAYEVGAGLHEVWLVSSDLLADWSAQLEGAEGIDPSWLPLREVGAIVGRVRDGATGQPIAGAEVVSIDGGDATVRYVADDGTIGGDATGSSGNFLVFGTAQVQTFAARSGGVEIGRATLGIVPRATFVKILQSAP